jgi:hypothetical protein
MRVFVCVACEFSWLGISAREELCEFVSETMGFIKNEESPPPSGGVSATLLHAAQFQRMLLGGLFSVLVIT